MRDNGPGACSGMVGCLFFLELVMDLLGLPVLTKQQLICLRVLWGLVTLQGWDVPQGVDWDSAADRMPAHPDVWSDGSLVCDEVSGSAFAGAGVHARLHADTRGTVGGSILMTLALLLVGWFLPVWVFVLFLVICTLFRGLSFGR